MSNNFQCKECRTFWVQCPCCRESFCPDCGKLETYQIDGEDDDDDDDDDE